MEHGPEDDQAGGAALEDEQVEDQMGSDRTAGREVCDRTAEQGASGWRTGEADLRSGRASAGGADLGSVRALEGEADLGSYRALVGEADWCSGLMSAGHCKDGRRPTRQDVGKDERWGTGQDVGKDG